MTDEEQWDEIMDSHQQDGRNDADKGEFFPPYNLQTDHPDEAMENHAYESGWRQRRKELGNAFKWA